jgi:hypothetical protein
MRSIFLTDLDLSIIMLSLSVQVLPPGGRVLLEVDPCHPHLLPAHLRQLFDNRLQLERIVKDFADKDRFVVILKEA